MKKILTILLPSILIFVFTLVDSMFPDSKYILLGIYLLFPAIFIIQGIICSDSMKDTLIGLLLSSIIIMVTTSVWYNMSSMLIPVIVYLMLGLIVSFATGRVMRKSINS